jgi:hypothetical protein
MAVIQPEKTAAGTRWKISGTMVQACNCDWGCPCEFNSRPTEGHCHGTWSWHVKEGHFGSTPLAGIHFAAACKWPGAIHEGNGECLPILDKRANESQIQAVASLLGGKAGGPWGIIASTLTKVHEPKVVEWDFKENGAHSTLRAGDVFHLELTPMTNPISGEPFEASVKLPDGFISHELAHSSTRTFKVSGSVSYAYPGKDAAYGHFDYEGVLAG